jgi:hypothetical protein
MFNHSSFTTHFTIVPVFKRAWNIITCGERICNKVLKGLLASTGINCLLELPQFINMSKSTIRHQKSTVVLVNTRLGTSAVDLSQVALYVPLQEKLQQSFDIVTYSRVLFRWIFISTQKLNKLQLNSISNSPNTAGQLLVWLLVPFPARTVSQRIVRH